MKIKFVGHVAPIGEMRNPYTILVEKFGGKRPLGKPRSRWEQNIKMYLKNLRVRDLSVFIWLRVGFSDGLL
jgi:hypothetical protein